MSNSDHVPFSTFLSLLGTKLGHRILLRNLDMLTFKSACILFFSPFIFLLYEMKPRVAFKEMWSYKNVFVLQPLSRLVLWC